MEHVIELNGIEWRVDIEITEYACGPSWGGPGQGASFDVVSVYVEGIDGDDVWPKLNAKTRAAIENHPGLQAWANEAEDDSLDEYLAECAEAREAWV